MISEKLLQKYAELAVKVGVNVQKGQTLFVNSSTETKELARAIAEEAYKAGARKVSVNWRDEYVGKTKMTYADDEELKHVPDWHVAKYKEFIAEKGCNISIGSPVPGLNNDVDPQKLQISSISVRKAMSFFSDFMMTSQTQWSVIAAPNPVWAKKVFPDASPEEAEDKLWNAILEASRVTETNDPVEDWDKHNKTISDHNKILNSYRFDTLYFKNGLGTDLSVKLVENHIWAGGTEHTPEGLAFNPNIPTEENFCMPSKFGVNGKVVATKPLNYQGKLIKDFWLVFKDGKVVEYDAKENKDALKNLLELDEGSSYLGEVALISYDSPISNTGILFYNTLFDENASCHLALGRAYTINIEGGNDMSIDELKEKGYNHSMAHSDFMFGSPDLSVIGKTKDGKEVVIFKDGNFVI